MQLSRFRALFPWRIALLLGLLPAIPLLIVGAWFRWELRPLERYYLRVYWDSSEGAKQPGNATEIQWLFKAAPGRKSQPVVDVDVLSEGMGSCLLGYLHPPSKRVGQCLRKAHDKGSVPPKWKSC
jgi:hypothetical protein